MSGNESSILLDLNYPPFQELLFDLDVSDLKKVQKTLKKVMSLSWNELFKDNGIKWEAVK